MTLNKQHPARSKGWLAPDDKTTHFELANLDGKQMLPPEVYHRGKRH